MPRFRLPTRRSARPTRPESRRSPVESLERRLMMAVFEFGNSTPIWIENGTFGEPGQARPYPVGLTVAGVTGDVRDIRVTFFGFNHERPADVDILLVSPERDRGVILVSDAGANFPVDGVDLTIATDATRSLPEFGQINGGSYRVTNYDEGDGDAFPGNVPDGMPTHESLSDFFDTEVNGVWHLFVVDDDFLGGVGGIPFGWSMTFITGGEGPPAPSQPDMTPGTDTGLSNSDNVTRDNTPTFRGTATDAVTVNLYANGVNVGSAAVSGGNWTVTTEVLGDGENAITARGVNAAGDEGDESPVLTVTIDTQAPPTPDAPALDPGSDTPPVGDNATADSTPTLTGSAPEAVTVALFADGTTALGTATVDASGNYSHTPTTPLSGGSHEIVAGSTDLAGNTSPLSAPLTLRIDPIVEEPANVAQVFIGGPEFVGGNPSAGQIAFRQAAGADATFGYAVPAGAAQLTPLTWVGGVRTIAVRMGGFTPEQFQQGDLVVRGSATANHAFSAFQWDPSTRTGVWTLATPVTRDKLRVFIDDANVPGLDGDWNNGSDAYPSGNGSSGGDFSFRVNVLAGDANGDGNVNALDVAAVKARLTRRPGEANYSIFADNNGDGIINALDLAAVKGRLTQRIDTLPEPA